MLGAQSATAGPQNFSCSEGLPPSVPPQPASLLGPAVALPSHWFQSLVDGSGHIINTPLLHFRWGHLSSLLPIPRIPNQE